MIIKCYGKYNKHEDKCKVCEHQGYCKGAGDPHFHTKRHGEAAIIQVEDINELADDYSLREYKEQGSARAIEEAFVRIVEQSDRNPLVMAIIIARFAGMSYAQIAKVFNIKKQAVHWHVKKIKNSELSSYLKQMKTSKHKSNSIKDAFLNGWYQPSLLPRTKYHRKKAETG